MPDIRVDLTRCAYGDYVKKSDGSVYLVNKGFQYSDLFELDTTFSNNLSQAIPLKQVAAVFQQA
jgi:hypothetical protein